MTADDHATHGPTLEFETLLRQVVERADAMRTSQARMRELIRVNNDLTRNLDLPTVLRRIVEIGIELVEARYGAMGVIGGERRLEQFIHVGMDDQVAARIDHLPEGKGLLGALIDDPHPVRVASIADDGRSVGFPAHHPPMESFIGVPIRVREKVFGNLYLTDSRRREFTSDDEELAQALAATAGIAIENARLFEDSEYRARWSTALVEVSRAMMSSEGTDEVSALIERLAQLASADLVSVARLRADDLIVDSAIGLGADSLIGTSPDLGEPEAGVALRGGEPRIVDDLGSVHPDAPTGAPAFGSAMLLPFAVGDDSAGLLCVARTRGREPFSPRDVDMGVSFAAHVGVVLDRDDARIARRRMALMEDRTRIARDLHDHVIQRLFATGLNLQAVAASVDHAAADQISEQVREIDGAITQIRQSIFAIRREQQSTTPRLRGRVIEIVDRTKDQLSQEPRLTFVGPVDFMTDAGLADDVAAVVTETLANVVKHADASQVDVTVSVADGQATVEVLDDGVGVDASAVLSGLANLRQRAEMRGGTFELTAPDTGGTCAVWSVPV